MEATGSWTHDTGREAAVSSQWHLVHPFTSSTSIYSPAPISSVEHQSLALNAVGVTSCHFLSASPLCPGSPTPLREPVEEVYYGIHFTDGKTKAWRSEVASPGSHSQLSSHPTGPRPEFLTVLPHTVVTRATPTLPPPQTTHGLCPRRGRGADLEVPGSPGRQDTESHGRDCKRQRATQLAGGKRKGQEEEPSPWGQENQPDTASIRASDLRERKWP